MFVNIELSGESCHWKVAEPQPVAGERVSTDDPLIQIEAGSAEIEGFGGTTVTVDCAVFVHLSPEVCVAEQVYVAMKAVSDFTYTVVALVKAK